MNKFENTKPNLTTDDNGVIEDFYMIDNDKAEKLMNVARLNEQSCHKGLKTLQRRIAGKFPFYREHPWLIEPERPVGQPNVYDVTILGADAPNTKTIYAVKDKWFKDVSASSPNSLGHQVAVATVRTHDDWRLLLDSMATLDDVCLIRGNYVMLSPYSTNLLRRKRDDRAGMDGNFCDEPRRWLCLDVDGHQLPDGLSYDDPAAIVAWLMESVMPPCFRGVSCTWNVSSSGGSCKLDAAHFHLFVFLETAEMTDGLRLVFQRDRETYSAIDPAACRVVQPIFCASPTIDLEQSWITTDPMEGRRVGFYQGTRDTADVAGVIAECRSGIEAENRKHEQKRQARLDRAIEKAETAEGRRELRTYGLPPRTDGHYRRIWDIIEREDMGTRNGNGYNGPIFSLMKAALKSGETDGFAIIDHIRHFVPSVAKRNGDYADYREKFVQYLDVDDLRRRLSEAAEHLNQQDGTDVCVSFSEKGNA